MKYKLQKFSTGMHYFVVGAGTAARFAKSGNRRVICTLNGALTFHCAFMPKKEGGFFVNVGSKICRALKLKAGDVVSAVFSVDKTTLQFDVPEEWTKVLETDPEAAEIFAGLTEGNKRGLIYLVTLVKSSEKRIERSLKIADRLKLGITSPRLILK